MKKPSGQRRIGVIDVVLIVLIVCVVIVAGTSERVRGGVVTEQRPDASILHELAIAETEGTARAAPVVTIIASYGCKACEELLDEIEPSLVREASAGRIRYNAVSFVPGAGGMELAATMIEQCSQPRVNRWAIREQLRRADDVMRLPLPGQPGDSSEFRRCLQDGTRQAKILTAGRDMAGMNVDYVPYVVVGDRVIRKYRNAASVARFIRKETGAAVRAGSKADAAGPCSTNTATECVEGE